MSSASSAGLPAGLASPPPPVPDTLVSFPAPHVLLVTLNRPKQLNCIPRPQHFALERLWDWYDDESTLRCAVITGTGRAFCAGADLKEWNAINTRSDAAAPAAEPAATTNSPSGAPSQAAITATGANNTPRQQQQQQQPDDRPTSRMPRGGFGGMSNRGGAKPILAAANGLCFGGGMEMAINCDMVIASASARFSLPEVTIGVIALAGALPRLVRSVGRQRASEMAMSGKQYTAAEMREWGLVNEIVPAEAGSDGVVEKALEWARRIAGNSPDAVIVSREGLKLGWEGVGPEMGTDMLIKGWYGRIEKGENMVEGVRSFNEKRKPVWKDSKL
ncbi:enoyl-CoA hydratase/isomerase [Apiospora hydei]|uniref:Enoyl-CoA hydratase/isomerase n=1 Tax=Apiospora hydei TaxID=1337664 RepID=A0ABR1W9D3_9PEZI